MNVSSNLSVIDAILLLKVESEARHDGAVRAAHRMSNSEANARAIEVLAEEHNTFQIFASIVRQNALDGIDDEQTLFDLAEHASLIASNYDGVVQAGFTLKAHDEAAYQLSASVRAAVEEGDSSLIVIRSI